MQSLTKLIPNQVKFLVKYLMHCTDFDLFMTKSYSQEGEDMILMRLFESQRSGFYIDVGAHHPKRFSNTYIFYKKGWKGINIDAMPGSMKSFRKYRSRDINIETPISNEEKYLTYYQFLEPALNSFCEELSQWRDKNTSYKIIGEQKIQAYSLKAILEKNLISNQEIDFLSVDVEGLDLNVLKSNDWLKFRPKVVLAEILESSLNLVQSDPIFLFMSAQNYHLYAKSVNTAFFTSDEFLTM
jgi:FkbM family methyltransferase